MYIYNVNSPSSSLGLSQAGGHAIYDKLRLKAAVVGVTNITSNQTAFTMTIDSSYFSRTGWLEFAMTDYLNGTSMTITQYIPLGVFASVNSTRYASQSFSNSHHTNGYVMYCRDAANQMHFYFSSYNHAPSGTNDRVDLSLTAYIFD